MRESYNYIGLIKIGERAHISELQKKGIIYSQTLEYFRKIEKEEYKLRRDTSEGAKKSFNIQPKEIRIGNHIIPISSGQGRLNEFDPNDDHTHIYCMYSLSSNFVNKGAFIDQRNFEFGNTALVIFKPEEFINRMHSAISTEFDIQPVQYYDENGDFENLTIFNKPNYFEYQNEMRINFKTKSPKPIPFTIGSIEDISLLIESNKLAELKIESA